MKQQQRWGFLTNHALVLVFVVRHSGATVREISAGVGVTERATLEILRMLSEEGIVERHREGRRNTYSVNFDAMAAYRREGTVTLTPRVFVDGLIGTLLAITDYRGEGGPKREAAGLGRARPEDRHLGVLHEPRAAAALDRDGSERSTVREMAVGVGVTERAVVAILNQLEDEGIIVRQKQGRRNTLPHRLRGAARLPALVARRLAAAAAARRCGCDRAWRRWLSAAAA